MRWMVLCLVLFAGCTRMNTDRLNEELKKVDRDFAQMSVDSGMVKAFEFYMADEGLVLPQQGHPRDKAFYSELLQQTQNTPTESVLNWEPLLADVSTAGDLGYTHGRYTLTFADTTKAPQFGYYVTIWKRQSDGQWRFVFDAGNQVQSFRE